MHKPEEKLTGKQKRRALQEHRDKHKRMYQAGKNIVITIAISNIALNILWFVFNTDNLLATLLQIIISIVLCFGIKWARIAFVLLAVMGLVLMFVQLSDSWVLLHTPIALLVFFGAFRVYQIVCSVLLIASKSVSEFLYDQKNG